MVWVKGAKLPMFRRMALRTENLATVHGTGLPPEHGVASTTAPRGTASGGREWIGKTAIAETVLRPSGKIRLGDVTCDAVSDGAFLEAGTPVSFDVLCNEIRGLGLNIQLEKKRVI